MNNEEYVFNRPLVIDQKLKDQFGSAAFRYSRERTVKSLSDFDESSLEKASLTPGYLLSRKVVFDKRTLHLEQTPYRNESYYPYDDEKREAFNMWNYPVGDNGYEELLEHLDLSEELGSFITECVECEGTGRVTCPECSGEGQRTCDCCGGKGEIVSECTQCYGTGRYNDDWCSKCDGTGKIYEHCNECWGRGWKQCRNCSGKGTVTCPSCEGVGRYRNYYVLSHSNVVRTWTAKSWSDDVRNAGFDPDNSFGNTVYEKESQKSFVDLPETGVPKFDRCFNDARRVAEGELFEGTRMLRERLGITRYDLITIRYNYHGKGYGGYMLDRSLFPVTSPYVEVSANLLSQVDKNINGGSFSQAKLILKEAEMAKVAQHRDAVAGKKKVIEGYFAHWFKIGTSVVFWASMLLIVPFLYNFYEVLNPVLPFAVRQNDPLCWFYGYVPLVQCFIYIVALISLKIELDDKGDDQPNEKKYLFNGMWRLLWRSLAAAAALIVLNCLGVGLITTFVGGVFLKILWLFLIVVILVFYVIYLIADVVIKFLGMIF